MIIQDAMLVLKAYPTPTSEEVIASGIQLAGSLNCRISAFVPETLIQVPGSFLGNSLINISGMAALEMDKSKRNAATLIKLFRDLAERNGIQHEVIKERELAGRIPALTAEYARLKDLILLPVSQNDLVDQWDTETIIFNSARPVLLLPEQATSPNASIDSIGVAWDYSRAAARAVADAMPILRLAKKVHVVIVLNEKDFDVTRKTHEIGAYLARHQVNVEVHGIDSAGQSIGEVLKDFANHHRLDLLVMGAYGHSRFREFVLGGATRSMIANPPVPLLLSH
ncbi:MAG: universal stress protein [Bradyrhizobiaceae bacterium]|nr:MAG: universal stress protein [Bradyrhizobiaceae bacterium]